tara:strand:+ start:129 stop:653 length:525 start_codon:yes stop_codon:yes gene_type:complete
MKKKIFGLCGWSGSGKTDLICRLLKFFSAEKLIVSTIKHTHHNFSIDKKGKDSFLHKTAGAYEVLINGGYNWAHMHHGKENEEISLKDLVEKISIKTDLILVEGFKKCKIKKIEIFNRNLNKPLLYMSDENILGLVIDKEDKITKQKNLEIFKFDDTEGIAKFILKHARNEFIN